MEQITDLLFSLEKPSSLVLALQLLLLLILSLLIVWVSMMIWSRLLRKWHRREPLDIVMRLAYMRSLLTYLILFSLYFFLLVKDNGLHVFQWDQPSFYLALAPRLLIFLLAIGFFVNRYNSLLKLLKQ